MANTIDELMNRPPDQFKGPKDPDFRELILYMRQARAKSDLGGRAKKSEISEDIDPRLREAMEKRKKKVDTSKGFRRW